MDDQNEKDIKGQSKSEGQSPKNDIPLWLQGLEDPDLEDTNPIYPESGVDDKWIKEISEDSPAKGDTFSSLEDDIRSDNVLPDWLSELSKVDPSPPEILENREDETDLDLTEIYHDNREGKLNEETDEIEIGKMVPEENSGSEEPSFDDGFIEISDVHLDESVQSEELAGNTMAAEETLPYWLRDMIAEPPKPVPMEEPSPTMDADRPIEQDDLHKSSETGSKAHSEQGPEPIMMDDDQGPDLDSEFIEKDTEIETPPHPSQVDEIIEDVAIPSESDQDVETIEAESIEVEVSEVEASEGEATKAESSAEETTSDEAIDLEMPVPDLPVTSDEVTKPIKVRLIKQSEEHNEAFEEPEAIISEGQQEGLDEARPAHLDEQQQTSAEIESKELQKIPEDIEEHVADGAESLLDETAQITPHELEQEHEGSGVNEDVEEKEPREQSESVTEEEVANIDRQPDVIPPPDFDVSSEERLLTEEIMEEAASSEGPEVVKTGKEGPPEYEIPMILEEEEAETIIPPQYVPEMNKDLPIVDEPEKDQRLEVPKPLLFARYLLEQGDIESATQILGPFIERAEHLDDIENWLMKSANDAAKTSSFVWEMIGDIALIQDDPQRALESYTKAIYLLLQSKKDIDETH